MNRVLSTLKNRMSRDWFSQRSFTLQPTYGHLSFYSNLENCKLVWKVFRAFSINLSLFFHSAQRNRISFKKHNKSYLVQNEIWPKIWKKSWMWKANNWNQQIYSIKNIIHWIIINSSFIKKLRFIFHIWNIFLIFQVSFVAYSFQTVFRITEFSQVNALCVTN